MSIIPNKKTGTGPELSTPGGEKSATGKTRETQSEKVHRKRKMAMTAERSAVEAERAAEANQAAADQSPVGQAISAANTALQVYGDVMAAYGSVMGATGALAEKAVIAVFSKLSGMQGIACLTASSQLDPVMGIDVHLVMIPPSPSPVPMPHPYVAIVMNPRDWVACAVMSVVAAIPPPPPSSAGAQLAHTVGKMALGMVMSKLKLGASVKLGFSPRTISGVENKVVPHFPMGASFAPAPVSKNNGHAQFGSLFVLADGEPFTGMMHLNNDCWDVGIMALMRKKSSPKPMQLFMPTGFVMAIPSHNVIVNPVPTPINPIAALTKVLNFGLAKILHKIINKLPPGLRNGLHKAVCHVTGHPVDVVSGMLFTDEEDFSLPGVIPLSWERTWFSDSNYSGPLGHGWYHNYDMWLSVDEDANRAVFRMNDGRGVPFKLPQRGKFTYDRAEKLFLHRHAEEGFYYITDRDGLIYRFTDQRFMDENTRLGFGLLSSISNANGYSIRFEYSAKGQLQKITDCAGRVLTVENDKAGHITRILAPDPVVRDQTFPIAQYDYDEAGNMICHTDALGQPMLFAYENNLLVREAWRNGMNWFFVYDGNSTGARCIHTWGDGDIYNHKLTYSEGCTKVENSLGHVTTYYHKNGLPYTKIDGNGAEWRYRYNKFNELEWETDPLGNQQNFSHDDWGNVITTTDPGGGFTSTGYFHPKFPLLPTEAMDAGGGKWKWEYDEKGNVTEQTNQLGAKTKYGYSDGLLAKIVNAAGAVTLLQYDRDQNLRSVLTDDSAVTEYAYDVLGNCTVITNPNGVKQRRIFDLKGRVEKVSDFDGNTIYLDYDGIDNVVHYRDNQKEVEYTYRGLWKLTSRTEAGATIVFKYDTEEQLRKIINEHNLPYRFELDAAGNVTEENGFDGITRRYERNAAGWVTKVLRPEGKFTQYSYDAAGRVTNVLYSDGKSETYAYRPDGELIQAVNESANVTFERDVVGNITKETVNAEWTTSGYDALGNRISIISSLGADIQQQYNKMGDVLRMQVRGWETRFDYDRLGLEVNRHLPGGISSQWQRDGIGRPVMHTVDHTAKNNFITRRKQYTWDVNDRLKQIRDERGITKFEHDAWSNLAKTIFPNGEEQWRNPDAVGNLFETADRKDRVYARGGQLKKAKGWEYSYDAEGNLVKKVHVGGDVWLYEWNDAGMLTKVLRPDKAEVSFAYDALCRRLWKRYKSTTTKYVWDDNLPLHEWKEHAITGEKLSDIHVGENGLTTWLFEPESFAPVAKVKGNKRYSIVADHLGTPAQMYTENGALIWDLELDNYGKVKLQKGELGSCPFRYQGQYEDIETGLHYNRFRYYDNDAGTFISRDPIETLSGELNFYAYVNDTGLYIDEFGLYKKAFRKRSKSEVAKLRKTFNKSARKKFLKKLAKDKKAIAELGLSKKDVAKMQKGKVPDGYIVHHKKPLYRGGDNSHDNLDLITKKEHNRDYAALHDYPEGSNPYGSKYN